MSGPRQDRQRSSAASATIWPLRTGSRRRTAEVVEKKKGCPCCPALCNGSRSMGGKSALPPRRGRRKHTPDSTLGRLKCPAIALGLHPCHVAIRNDRTRAPAGSNHTPAGKWAERGSGNQRKGAGFSRNNPPPRPLPNRHPRPCAAAGPYVKAATEIYADLERQDSKLLKACDLYLLMLVCLHMFSHRCQRQHNHHPHGNTPRCGNSNLRDVADPTLPNQAGNATRT